MLVPRVSSELCFIMRGVWGVLCAVEGKLGESDLAVVQTRANRENDLWENM